jgi:aspartate aminotransferase
MNAMISPAAAGLRQNDIRLVGQRIAHLGSSPLRLDIGEPDLPPGRHIMEAAAAAAARPTSYTPAGGTQAFRAAAAEYLERHHRLTVSPDDIVIGAGATGALMNVFLLLARPGDEFLVPVPGFPCYRTQIELVGGTAVGYPLRSEHDWLPVVEEIAERITPRTRAIVINTPGNPTGAVMPRPTLEELAELAHTRGIQLISDEVYADFAFDAPAVSAAAVDREHTFAVFSLSKTFSMTGWRVGFTVAPPSTATTLTAVNSQTMSSPNSVAQAAAIAALTGPWDEVSLARKTYAARRDAVDLWLKDNGIPHTRPSGAFYQILPLRAEADSFTTAMNLIESGVALVPGSAFKESGEPFLRMSLTAEIPELLAGLQTLQRHVWA